MNPITTYLRNLFASKRIIGNHEVVTGLVKVDSLISNLINEKKVPGLAITVLKNGKAILQKGYGYADFDSKTPIDPKKSIFRIASVSKNIAATALAHMVYDGLIDLDASFYTYVPYYPKKKWDFTIRQLAGHTAGIRGYQGTEYGLNKPLAIKESIELFATDDLLFQPGTDYLYTSFDWVLISLAMQEVSKIPFENYVQDKVLKPLKMGNTFAPTTYSKSLDTKNIVGYKEHKTSFYSKNRLGFRKAIPVNNSYKLAGGGYLSTSEDIAKFGQAYLDENVLPEEIITSFLTAQEVNGNNTYYGLGWQVSEDKKGRKYYGHVGNGVGGYSNLFIYPKEKLVFVVLINCTNPGVQKELDVLVDDLIANTADAHV